MNRRRYLSAVGLATILPLAGCTGDEAEYETTDGAAEASTDAPTDESADDTDEVDEADAQEVVDDLEQGENLEEFGGLRIVEHELVNNGDEYMDEPMVTGIVENTGEERESYAEVRVRLYDTDGHQIESWIDNTTDLDSGATWRFEVSFFGTDMNEIGDYDIAVVNSALA